MLTRFTPIVALILLSGCTLTNSEQYHQETLAAIQASEANLTNQYTNLNLQLSNQSDYIESLENQVHDLESQLVAFKSEALEEVRKKPDPVVIPAAAPIEATPSHEIVLGEVEKVIIDSIKQSFDARIDTGAATSSLNAVDIEQFERNGKNWVRFHLSDGEKELNDTNWIEAPIVRFVKIRQSTNEEVERRAVVELWVKLGKIHEKAQFTLADRSQMSHPVLLGREFIRDIAVVDVSKKYIHTEVPQKQ
ncbi:ATP-dependent zinc protease [Vibrio europaeus]|uniref:ATP-dependent Zn protease n=1 Tax=Vibrio europaeus TaxID=300876 RepID=A0A178JCJ4_9VIBR|nr:ATP-dependent zinc protease [Vibrio europaeus]MDC5703735.1 ATP-dependent zinc protease [Vibrio europaeus]MDC5708311.1 ATP-dependent zinc protease [Vibrio europaeus]MDC5714282.1 ATP-dependent zinc protease [Vibrio europaeus]MDC5722497.1 ATP-dependent zinc protease [Vibrio europaeus]MDC5727222.1 ATP-dependent zinc protease [Vibrio europaeus]